MRNLSESSPGDARRQKLEARLLLQRLQRAERQQSEHVALLRDSEAPRELITLRRQRMAELFQKTAGVPFERARELQSRLEEIERSGQGRAADIIAELAKEPPSNVEDVRR